MKKRLAFIDLLRGWSLIIMIEVHVFNSMLIPELKNTSWFSALNFVNGLVAPAFLFISGFSFYFASQRKLEEFRKLKFQFWRQLGRIGMILMIGYLLHLPFLSMSRTINDSTREQLKLFMSVDILHCIAIGILILFILRVVIKSDKSFKNTLLALSVIIIVISTFMWQIDFQKYLPVIIANYFTPKYGSLFPIFPWLGFMLLGAVFSIYYFGVNPENEKKYLERILIFGVILVFSGFLILSLPIEFLKNFNEIKPNPFFFILRLGFVLILFVFFRYYELKRKTEKSFVLLMGRESLLVYWLHLQVIYRQIAGKNLDSIVNKSFSVIECIAATVIIIFLMASSAKLWETIKKRYPYPSQLAVAGTLLIILVIFVLR